MLIYLQISNFFFKLWQNSQGLQMSILLSEKYHKLSKFNSYLVPQLKLPNCLNIFSYFLYTQTFWTKIKLTCWKCILFFQLFTCYWHSFTSVKGVNLLTTKKQLFFFSNFGKIPKTYECQCHCLKSIINCLNVEGILPHLTRSDF